MKDTSGFTNWETRRMYEIARKRFAQWSPWTMNYLVEELGCYERKIKEEGFNTFVPYSQDQVNWWEILGRLNGLRPEEDSAHQKEDSHRAVR